MSGARLDADADDFLARKSREVRAARELRAAGAKVARQAEHRRSTPERREQGEARGSGSPRLVRASFRDALLAGDTVAVIAEFKRRSPSAGALVRDERPEDVARLYAGAGAAAVSVLTDATDFGGSLDDLHDAHAAGLPTLRKDFIVDTRGLEEARAAGASAALLIVAMLDDVELAALVAAAAPLGLGALVEVHDERELDRALAADATLIGINNRDLRSLRTDLSVTERVARRVPPNVVLVSESGIRDADDVARVRDAGAHAVLVGESLLRREQTARAVALRALASVPR